MTLVGWSSRSTSRTNWQTIQKMRKEFKKRNRRLTESNGRWQDPPRSPASIVRALLLLLLLLAVIMIGSFFEVMCPFALSLLLSRACFTRNNLPNLYSLSSSFVSILSCGVRIRRKIIFIRTNLVRENESSHSYRSVSTVLPKIAGFT